MGSTVIEKILARHGERPARPGDIVELAVDTRIARDFGGASVVRNIEANRLQLADPARTCFTFDCNPTGSDQRYAANQQRCRVFARARGVRVFDIDKGIGTHLAIDEGLIGPGETLVSTDSHANILGAIGAFGQGMGDRDVACAFACGQVWFETPGTVRVVLTGTPAPGTTAKDVVLALLRHFGASGLLGCAAELYGNYVEQLSLDARITISSMATEMGAICLLIPPDAAVLDYCRKHTGREPRPEYADPDADYLRTEEIDIEGLEPQVARPGHPDDVTTARELSGTRVDSSFIGSCTNGRYEDLRVAADVLRNRHVAPGVVLKIVPATDAVWRRCLDQGLVAVFKDAGALLSNAGCAGCAAGQVGQNGPGEVTISTGNRNYPGKQGKGEVYLASPATTAASAVAGAICTADRIPDKPVQPLEIQADSVTDADVAPGPEPETRPTVICGRVWIVDQDNIDTDMIYHNRHLAVTDPAEMGRHAFGNLDGWHDFADKANPGDVIVTGANFGAGSSRQHAVDCFKALGVTLIVARSFGAIYFRNAVNAGMPVLVADLADAGLRDGDEIEADLVTGNIRIVAKDATVRGRALSPVLLDIYRRGDLLANDPGS